MVTDNALEARLFRKVKKGKAVLFLGAGSSRSAGVPLGTDLARMIHEEFLPGIKLTSADFIEVVSQVINTPGIDRSAVEDFIRSKLTVQPSQTHLDMCQIRWQAIFTTNFDELVETAYHISPKKAQDRCDSIYDKRFSRTQTDYMEVVRLFKLMGSMNGTDRISRMALTRSDYHRKLQQREGLFRLLKDFARDGTIVYAGYSFSDLIVIDILNEIQEEIPSDELPWGWALLPECDEATEQLLRERRILPLKMTFEEFVARSVAMLDQETGPEAADVYITVGGITVKVPESDKKMYTRQFEFCHDETGTQTVIDQVQAVHDFLEGRADPWIGIERKWAFKRPKAQEIMEQVRYHLKRPLDRECPIVLVLGPAGSGKSILARLVAREVFKVDGFPCIFLNPETEKVDYRVVDSYARFLTESVESVKASPSRLPLLIVIDEAAMRIPDIRRLPQFLISRGVPAILLALARENEWKQAEGEYPIKVSSIITINDELESDEETESLLQHLRSLGVFESAQDNNYWISHIKSEYENSFWNTLYYLAEPTRPPLILAVRSEYDRLTPLAQTAYRYICIFYQFGIPLDLELLARSLHHSYDEFVQSVYDPASLGVIIELPAPAGTIRYRARSRMVAEQVVNYFYQDIGEWLTELKSIVSNSIPNNANEVDTLRSLLIHRLGPNGAQRINPPDLLIPVFEAAFEAGMRDSACLHHCSLLLLEMGDYNGAEAYAKRAMDVINDPNELAHFKTEWRQMIDNSLGTIVARRGLSLQKMGKESQAIKDFERATVLFKRARNGEFPTAYPFYGEALMLLRRAENTGGIDRLPLLASALQVIDQSEGNVDEEGQSSLAEMESKIVQVLSNIPRLNTVLEDLAGSGDPTGSYLQARCRSSISGMPGSFSVEKAYSIVMDALSRTPQHVPCLRLASRLHRKVHPNDWNGWWDLLQKRIRLEVSEIQSSLLFDLAYAACQLGKYHDAGIYFEQLDELSIGHPRRSGVVAIIKDNDEDRRFTGEVKPGLTRNEGWLRCDTIGRAIRFFPLRQKFTPTVGQRVTFILALNYRGFFAMELRPA